MDIAGQGFKAEDSPGMDVHDRLEGDVQDARIAHHSHHTSGGKVEAAGGWGNRRHDDLVHNGALKRAPRDGLGGYCCAAHFRSKTTITMRAADAIRLVTNNLRFQKRVALGPVLHHIRMHSARALWLPRLGCTRSIRPLLGPFGAVSCVMSVPAAGHPSLASMTFY